MPKKRRRRGKKKISRTVPRGIVHIKATFNNTIITVTDPEGNVLCWGSGGTVGYSGTRKSTPFVAQLAAQQVVKKALEYGMREVEVRVKGPGSGREAAIRAIQSNGLNIVLIKDVTPIPHDGCRPPKRRRV